MKILKVLIAVMAVLVTGTTALGISHAVSSAGSDDAKAPVYEVFIDEPFDIPDVKGKALCVSSDKSIAKANLNGEVESKKAGKVSVKIHTLTKSKTVHLDVAKRQSIKTKQDKYFTEFGQKPFSLEASSNAKDAKLVFTSSDEKVAKVDEKGKVKIISPGEAVIMVKAERTPSYHKAEKEIPLTVGKKKPKVSFEKGSFEISTMKKGEKVELKTDSNAKVKYSVEDKKIAEINDKGEIVPKKEGETNIIVSIGESKTYVAAEAKLPLKVRKPTASDKALAAVDWAKQIAEDDSFTYGTGGQAHRGGCYFCGTNKRKKPKGYEKTYCCNPFVFAAYAHGAQIPSILNSCQNGGCGGMEPYEWEKFGFVNVGACKDVSCDKLLPGDVILSDNNVNGWYHHVWIVGENGEYMEAAREGWDAESIAVYNDLADYYKKYQKHKGCYVMRYTE